MFDKYFQYTRNYPCPTEDILPLGERWDYISSTFLNGWINYVKIISARLITRYAEDGYEGNIIRAKKWHNDNTYHSKFVDLGDDVLILAKDDVKRFQIDRTPYYWFFWFDMDGSDCCIGRFRSDDHEEQIKKLFDEYADESSRDLSVSYGASKSSVDSIDIDPKSLCGWISF